MPYKYRYRFEFMHVDDDAGTVTGTIMSQDRNSPIDSRLHSIIKKQAFYEMSVYNVSTVCIFISRKSLDTGATTYVGYWAFAKTTLSTHRHYIMHGIGTIQDCSIWSTHEWKEV